MTPQQFKQVYKLSPRPHSPLKQWHIYAILIAAYFVLPLIVAFYFGILPLAIQILLADLLIRKRLQPYFAQSFLVIREGLQRLAGTGILLSLISLVAFGLIRFEETVRYFNEGAGSAADTIDSGMLRTIMLTLLVLFISLLAWVVIGGYYRLKKMLDEKRIKNIKKEELFQ